MPRESPAATLLTAVGRDAAMDLLRAEQPSLGGIGFGHVRLPLATEAACSVLSVVGYDLNRDIGDGTSASWRIPAVFTQALTEMPSQARDAMFICVPADPLAPAGQI